MLIASFNSINSFLISPKLLLLFNLSSLLTISVNVTVSSSLLLNNLFVFVQNYLIHYLIL